MSNWAAPAVVFALGSTYFTAIGEPFGVVLTGVVALLGYSINKKAN
jgi:hypothetical protein